MNPAKQDFILEKHVFKMMEIETASACEVNCFMEADCVSYNLKPQQNGTILCELSDSDHPNNQQDLRYKEGTVYKSFKVSWIILIYFECMKRENQNKIKERFEILFTFHVKCNFISSQNRCSSMLCPSTKRCQTGFTRKGYRCVCANGLLGENCTEGMSRNEELFKVPGGQWRCEGDSFTAWSCMRS